ncbi:MAG TPA: LON peptidase substrate-binding domain-containing protein [Pirellulales bacterium]|jgi:Lon protease-like protein|nr:LON peptidase substrate-binding domain-containing protein [Pirellulales bacterium]
MTTHGDLTFDPQKFSGRLRLFPLPDLVMFPHVMQPLHVFEPRYRDLVAASVADDHLLGMAVLAPGWESNYEGRPAIGSIACLTRIASCRQLPDGRYNLFVLGLQRVEIVREIEPNEKFREAEVRLLEDLYPAAGSPLRPALQQKLTATFKQILPKLSDNFEQFAPLLSNEIPLGMLTDIVAFAVDLGHDVKRQLLEEQSVDRRAELLLARLADPLGNRSAMNFPPAFSVN